MKTKLQQNNFILPHLKGNLYKSRAGTQLNKQSTRDNHPKIPQFIAALDPLIEQNTFDSISNANYKIHNKPNVILRKK